jgi:Holliday junction resolvasome RuvABC endonuclease subunit
VEPATRREGTAVVITGNILGLDPGTQDLGWSVVAPHTGRVLELGVVHQERDDSVAKSTDRARRVHVQAQTCRDLIRRYEVRAIAAEAASFNPRSFTMAAGLCMSIGALTGLAAALGIALYELPPKRWQGAILGRTPDGKGAPGAKGKIDYAEVERLLIAFLAGAGGTAVAQLAAIPKGLRNHARDAAGIGVFAVFRPDELSRSPKAIFVPNLSRQ